MIRLMFIVTMLCMCGTVYAADEVVSITIPDNAVDAVTKTATDKGVSNQQLIQRYVDGLVLNIVADQQRVTDQQDLKLLRGGTPAQRANFRSTFARP